MTSTVQVKAHCLGASHSPGSTQPSQGWLYAGTGLPKDDGQDKELEQCLEHPADPTGQGLQSEFGVSESPPLHGHPNGGNQETKGLLKRKFVKQWPNFPVLQQI